MNMTDGTSCEGFNIVVTSDPAPDWESRLREAVELCLQAGGRRRSASGEGSSLFDAQAVPADLERHKKI